MTTKPGMRPARPYFSSGPCAKRPGWSLQNLGTETLGRSHRAKLGKTRLNEAIDRTRALLEVPDGYRIGIVPASDTGAVEMALWSLLGPRPVTMLAWESFGEGWITDVVKQLKLDATALTAPYGALPDLSKVDPASDVVFTWNGTTSGVRVPNADWIAADREGLTICDATSAAFAQPLDWAKLDATTFSFQKALGGEGAHGVLVLSPRAVARLESYKPSMAAAENLPPDQRRQAHRRDLRRRDDQHAVDACDRGLGRCAQMGRVCRRIEGTHSPRRFKSSCDHAMGRADRLGRVPVRRRTRALEHLRLPQDRRSESVVARR